MTPVPDATPSQTKTKINYQIKRWQAPVSGSSLRHNGNAFLHVLFGAVGVTGEVGGPCLSVCLSVFLAQFSIHPYRRCIFSWSKVRRTTTAMSSPRHRSVHARQAYWLQAQNKCSCFAVCFELLLSSQRVFLVARHAGY